MNRHIQLLILEACVCVHGTKLKYIWTDGVMNDESVSVDEDKPFVCVTVSQDKIKTMATYLYTTLLEVGQYIPRWLYS